MTRYAAGTLLSLFLLLTGCGPDGPLVEQRRTTDFGETELTLVGLEADRAQRALSAAAEDLHFIAEVSAPGRPGPLGRTNQLLALTAEFSANPSLLPLIRRAQVLSKRTGGLFNPALGRLHALWGSAGPPDQTTLRAVLRYGPTMADIVIDGIRMRPTNPAVQLDFGAFAAGYAIDTAMASLREAGGRRAAVRTAHGLSVLGQAPTGRWRLTVPLTAGEQAEVTLRGGEAAYTVADAPAHHPERGPIDPRTGQPATGFHSVTVVAPSAYATALLVSGTAHWRRLASSLGVTSVLTVAADGEFSATPAMTERLKRWPAAHTSPKG